MTLSAPSVWLHMGAGSLHRDHQAWYLHHLLVAGDSLWENTLSTLRNDVAPLLTTLRAVASLQSWAKHSQPVSE